MLQLGLYLDLQEAPVDARLAFANLVHPKDATIMHEYHHVSEAPVVGQPCLRG